jgi:predicted ATPase/DNA-binding SARP family transcriptional activator
VAKPQFRLLGPMEMTVDGEPVRLPGAAERALLVQLLLAPGRTIPATVLVDRLWSESTLPADPLNAVQIRVSKLRRSLKVAGTPDLVGREGVGYRAHIERSGVDAIDFGDRIRAARGRAASGTDAYDDQLLSDFDTALSLWRGEPLSDFATEPWAAAEAARLTELRLSALTERTQVALALGRHAEVVADLEPVVAQDPSLESLAGLLMIALYRSGRQASALEAYDRTRVMLDEHLGLEPSVSLRSLQERVLRQDPSLGVQPELANPVPVASSAARRRASAEWTTPTNLPKVARRLIGRDDLLVSVSELAAQARMLTLIGPGGAGKTSLALAAVVGMASDFPDGVFGVRLASVNAADQVPVAVADALSMPMDGAAVERDVHERLVGFLAQKTVLLLLDNCEHVIDPAATLADQLVSRCPGLTVLATSREALAVPDEVQVNVGPLDTPPEGAPAAEVLSYPACELFAERAHAVHPSSTFGERDLLAIGRIARALDGIPLALELAAARTASMSPSEISDRLEHRFSLLTTGSRTAEARQQTLRATVDWSYALLTDDEQHVFNQLSVFQGGWTLEAAEAVIGGDALPMTTVLDTTARLVEQSMVVVEPGSTTRYRMLETLRQYAVERVAGNGQQALVAGRHARHFYNLTRSSEALLRGPGQRDARERLRQEQPNIRAALTWLSGPDGDVDLALECAGSLGLFWHLGRHLEGRDLLARLLQLGGSDPARAHALQAVSLVERPRACLVHPSALCAQTARDSLNIFERLGDRSNAALSKVLLAVEGVTGADRERSEALLREAEEQFLHNDDEWGLGVIGFVRMETALKTGDLGTAVSTGRAAATRFRRLDDPWGLSAIMYHLGWGLRQFGRYDEGARSLEEAIDVAAGAGLYNTVQWALADLAIVELNLDRPEAARRLFDRANAASEHVGDGAGAVLAEYGHGLLALGDGEVEVADNRFDRAVDGFAALRTPVWEGWALLGRADCAELRGDPRNAEALYGQSRALGVGAGEPGLTASALEGLARVLATNDPPRAADLAGQAADVRRRLGRPLPPYQEKWRRGSTSVLPATATKGSSAALRT